MRSISFRAGVVCLLSIGAIFGGVVIPLASCGSSSASSVSGGVITTVAGNGTQGYSGDNASATSGQLNNPRKVAMDASGNLYVADAGNNAIRKVTPGGRMTTVAGTGTAGYTGDGDSATSATLNNPQGIAVDSSGNIFIADTGNHVVREVIAGIITTYAGRGIRGYTGDNGAATDATLSSPSGLSLDSAGNLYIADLGNHAIRKITASTSVITTVAGTGTRGYTGDGAAATAATLNFPVDVAVDASGNLYIADENNYVIRKVTASTGAISTVAGNGKTGYSGDGGAATSAQIAGAYGVAADASGNFYIADYGNNVIRKVSSAGTISTAVGTGAAGYTGDKGKPSAAELVAPTAVTIDSSSGLYIADTGNNVIRKVAN